MAYALFDLGQRVSAPEFRLLAPKHDEDGTLCPWYESLESVDDGGFLVLALESRMRFGDGLLLASYLRFFRTLELGEKIVHSVTSS